MTQPATTAPPQERSNRRVTRLVLASFLFTFVTARVLVLLIMTHRLPVLYLHAKGTHVHHLNYGIFLLSLVGAYLVFRCPTGKRLSAAAIVYGIGLGLTFDEFGMWLNLSDEYWQWASFDAVAIVAAVLGLIAAAPTLKRFRPHHWFTAVLLLLLIGGFISLASTSMHYAKERFGPILNRIELNGPAK